MMSRSIYPSIPDPGNKIETMVPTLLAVKQTLQMILLNAQRPNPNYTPSSAAQVFVTNNRLAQLGVKGVTPSTIVREVPDNINIMRAELADLKARVAKLEAKIG